MGTGFDERRRHCRPRLGGRLSQLPDNASTIASQDHDTPRGRLYFPGRVARELLERLLDLSEQLRSAPPELQRQVFDAFDLRVTYDRAAGRITISATVTEAIARHSGAAPNPPWMLATGGMAGAGFEPAKAEPRDLQSRPFDRSGTPPRPSSLGPHRAMPPPRRRAQDGSDRARRRRPRTRPPRAGPARKPRAGAARREATAACAAFGSRSGARARA